MCLLAIAGLLAACSWADDILFYNKSNGSNPAGKIIGPSSSDDKIREEILANGEMIVNPNSSPPPAEVHTASLLAQEAEPLSTLGCDLQPEEDNASAWICQGYYLLTLGRGQRAEEDFGAALMLNPCSGLAQAGRYLASKCSSAKGKGVLSGDNSDLYARLKGLSSYSQGLGQASQSNHEEALRHFEISTAFDPKLSRAWIAEGAVLALLNRNDEAVEAYGRALELDENFTLEYLEQGMVLADSGHFNQSLKMFNRAIEIDQSSAMSWSAKGSLLERMEEHDLALDCYDQALQLDPDQPLTLTGKAMALEALGFHDQALELLDKAIEQDPNSSLAWSYEGLANERLGQYMEAIECYDQASELNPHLGSLWIDRWRANAGLGRFDDALDSIKAALEFDPQTVEAWKEKNLELTNPVEMSQIRGPLSSGGLTCTPENFSWFGYDPDSGGGGERLRIDLTGRQLGEGGILYTSRPWSHPFEHRAWGYFRQIGFLGKVFLADYQGSPFSKNESFLGRGELREILLNGDETVVITKDKPLLLKGGYSLRLKEASGEGDQAYLVLFKDGLQVCEAVVRGREPFVYRVGPEEIPAIIVAGPVCMKAESGEAVATVDGVFQIADPAVVIRPGQKLGVLQITSLSEDGLTLENYREISLGRDELIPLAGDLYLKTLDTPSLSYYPVGRYNEHGIYMKRGSPSDKTGPTNYTIFGEMPIKVEAVWNCSNFPGFYFDPQKRIGQETMIINSTEDRSIPFSGYYPDDPESENTGIIYYSLLQPLEFEYKGWGDYDVISLFGHLWFAGYGPNTTLEIGNLSLLDARMLGRVLIDTDHKEIAFAGRLIPLKEGYSLEIADVAEDRILVRLRQNGLPIKNSTLMPNSTFVYKSDLRSRFGLSAVEDFPLIAIHIGQVFAAQNKRLAEVDGIFQASEKQFIPIDIGRDYGKLEIAERSHKRVVLASTEYIDLLSGHSANLWPTYSNFIQGMDLWTAKNDTLRFFPYTLDYIPPEDNSSWVLGQ
jgi:S-layer protein (TIGR01567 family)